MTDRKRHIFYILGLVFLVVSCQHIDKMKKPDNLIPEDKMVDILTELSLVQAARNYNRPKLEKLGITPNSYIYKKFDIDSLQFEKSSAWYAEHYVQYDRIYDSVKSRIELMKVKIDSIRDVERKIEDSIKQAKKDSLKATDSLKYAQDSILELKKRYIKKDSLIMPPSISTERDSLL